MPAIAVALFVCGACLALVLNQYWLSDAQEELRTVAQSAALAGAQQLACDDLLKPDFDSYENADHVRLAVENQSQRNQVSGPVPARLEVRLGKIVIDPVTGQQHAEETDDFPTNVLVAAHRDRRRGNPVGLMAPAFVGQSGADVTATTEASICNVISGVRPVGAGNVPAWPIAILETSDDERLPCWTRQIEQRLGTDEYGWDSSNHAVISGPDGLPEITLTQQTDDQPGNVCLVDIGSGWNEEILDRQFREGWSSEDLEDWGGEFVFDTPSILLPGKQSLRDIDLSLLEQQLGMARILFLYERLSEATGDDVQVHVTRLVGARLMAIHKEEGTIQLIFQPAVIATRTAVIDQEALSRGETRGNPYIYKISLTQ